MPQPRGAAVTITTLADDIRTRLTDALTHRLGARKVQLWLDAGTRWDLATDGVAPSRLRVVAPSRFVADRMRRAGVVAALDDAAKDVLDPPVRIEVVVDPTSAPPPIEAPPHDAARPAPAAQPAAPRRRSPRRSAVSHPPAAAHPYATTGLAHRLDDFVVGPCNQLAHAAATRLADADPNDPADKQTLSIPLFLHGGCGRGKTHLLQGVCRAWRAKLPGARVLYLTGEQFTNRYIDAAKQGQLDAFRREMRRVDLLALDDVHFIAGKDKTQTELLHMLDAVSNAGCAVMLASDVHPRQITAFPEALASRCLRGLVLELEAPDTAMRRKLIMALGAKRGLVFQPAAVELLAGQCGPSVRELEGLLLQLQALSTLDPASKQASGLGVNVGMALVDKLLHHQRRANPVRPVTVPALLAVVAQRFGITPRAILGNGRKRDVVLARSVVAYLAYTQANKSYPEVAAAMNRPNHSSVITSAKRVRTLLEGDAHIDLPTRDDAVRVKDLLDDLLHAARQWEA
ncbi:MAG: DnaA/Hda family protein [Planctomycetota bacterium]